MYLTGYELFHMTKIVYIIMFGKTCFQEQTKPQTATARENFPAVSVLQFGMHGYLW